MPPSPHWFTCTPVRFKGDHTFFARASGLLCKGFQQIGLECRAILPSPPMADDLHSDLIRTDFANLEDYRWWGSLAGEGVVFYGWGSGKYVRIARAIKRAGMVLVSHMDGAGMLGILNGVPTFGGTLWRTTRGEAGSSLAGSARFLARFVYAASIGLIRNDWRRARHLRQADVIGAISPIALQRIRKVCRIYGGEVLASRVHLVPHPNATYMAPDPAIRKERLLVAAGRWDDHKVKGTDLLMATCGRLLDSVPALRIEIYGRTTSDIEAWRDRLCDHSRHRLALCGVVPNKDLRLAFQRARVGLCTSLRESYHIASAEALCCGCSVVGPDVPEIPSMKWFTDGPYGTMAARTPEALAQAVRSEFSAWDCGARNPVAISSHWASLLHAPNVARRILDLFSY